MGKLKNKVAIITGSGKGIGKGIAKRFVEEGAKVIIATKEKEGILVQKELESLKGEALFIQTDVSSEESIINMVKQTINHYKTVDILVNNAGITLFKTLDEATIDDWNNVIDIDLRGSFLCTKYVLPYMKENGGSIINISSNHAFQTLPNTEIYAAAKGGVNSMTRSMALSLGQYNIRVNAICPGFTSTPHYDNWLNEHENPERLHNTVLNLHAVKNINISEDIANLALFMSTEESRNLTGEAITLDGGLSSYLYHES